MDDGTACHQVKYGSGKFCEDRKSFRGFKLPVCVWDLDPNIV